MLGTFLIGIANLISSLLSIFTLNKFGRKTLLLTGQILMGICMVAAGLTLHYKSYLASFILILLFICSFNFGTGSVAWVYCSEVTMDKASGFVVGAMFFTSLIYTFAMEYMLASKMQAFGTFILFGGVSLIGALFV